MAEKEKYIINIQGELVEVSPDIYKLYFRMERQERNQVETSQRHEVSYDALDNGETVGVERMREDSPVQKIHICINAAFKVTSGTITLKDRSWQICLR